MLQHIQLGIFFVRQNDFLTYIIIAKVTEMMGVTPIFKIPKPPYAHQDGYYKDKQTKQKVASVGEAMKKLEPLCSVDRSVKWCAATMGNSMVVAQNISHRITV